MLTKRYLRRLAPEPRSVRGLLLALGVGLLVLCLGAPLLSLGHFLGRLGHAQEYMTGYRRASEHPLVHAAMLGDLARVEALLDQGIPIEDRGEDGRTALHWAAFSNQTETLATLLARGASTDAVDAAGDTPLHLAASEEHPEAVAWLLAAGADPEARDRSGRTPLDRAREAGSRATLRALGG